MVLSVGSVVFLDLLIPLVCVMHWVWDEVVVL